MLLYDQIVLLYCVGQENSAYECQVIIFGKIGQFQVTILEYFGQYLWHYNDLAEVNMNVFHHICDNYDFHHLYEKALIGQHLRGYLHLFFLPMV